MKKNTKSSGRNRKPARHAKPKQKPVTIDLKAEKIEPKTAATPAKRPAKTKTSVPKSTRPKPIDEKTPNLKQSTRPKDFGRTTTPSSSSKSSDSQTSSTINATAAPASTVTPNKSNGLFGKFAAGVIGGAIALGGAGGLQYMGVLSSLNTRAATKEYVSSDTLNTAREELLSRIAGLETQLKQTATTPAPTIDMDAINTTIDARIKKLTAQENNRTNNVSLEKLPGQFQAINKKLKTLENQILVADKTVQTLKNAISSGDAGESAGLVTLNKTVDNLKSKVGAIAATAQSLAVSANGREEAIAALQKAGSTPSMSETSSAGSNDLNKTIAALESKIDSIAATAQSLAVSSNQRETAISELQKQASSNSTNNQDETAKTIAALQSKLSALASTAQSLAASSNERQEAISSLEKQAGETANLNKQSANAIAAAALKNDIDRGLPFATSLNRLTSSAGDSKALSSLAPYAKTGVPTVTQLTDQFAPISKAIIAALAPKPKEDFVSRLFAGAKSLVKVRSIKPQTGSSPTALVSQITAGLTSGNLKQSSKSWEALPKAGQEISANWHEGLKARITTDRLVGDTLQSFLLSNAGN